MTAAVIANRDDGTAAQLFYLLCPIDSSSGKFIIKTSVCLLQTANSDRKTMTIDRNVIRHRILKL
jgi:hypothetical protein